MKPNPSLKAVAADGAVTAAGEAAGEVIVDIKLTLFVWISNPGQKFILKLFSALKVVALLDNAVDSGLFANRAVER